MFCLISVNNQYHTASTTTPPTTTTTPPNPTNFMFPQNGQNQNQNQNQNPFAGFGGMGGMPDISQMQNQLMQNPEMVRVI